MSQNIGVDILHLPRIVSLLSRRSISRFSRKILTPTELAEFQTLPSSSAAANLNLSVLANPQTRFLATRWAAKEAAYKASGDIIPTTPAKWMGWKNFEIVRGSRGEPLLTLRDDKGFKMGTGKVSISHDGEYVIAMVMVPQSFTK
ncbi:hypothetical protein TWF694_008744 [Orbilia ellipsospora]|uniref:4'-phosphopantetheinyl transferase domain-containing protein n=1 Tax=Orbilia ellipsospora TaxID=2528407 RepID=A0AAV9XFL3_9PEZI